MFCASHGCFEKVKFEKFSKQPQHFEKSYKQQLGFSKIAFLTWVAFTLTRAQRAAHRKLNTGTMLKICDFPVSGYQYGYM
jgi:hypothetical protein